MQARRFLLALMVLVSVGCSPGVAPSPTDPHGVVTTTTIPVTTTTMSIQDAMEAYRSCLGDEGVIVDEFVLDALGRPRMALALADLDLTDSNVVAALETCGQILASGLLDLEADPELGSMVRSQLEALAECIRASGVEDFPDPAPDFDGVGPPFPAGLIPWSDPALPDAMADCSVIGRESL